MAAAGTLGKQVIYESRAEFRPAPSRRGRIIKNPELGLEKTRKDMAEAKEEITPTPEELEKEKQEDEEILTRSQKNEKDIRQELIDELGLDEEADAELLDKLTKKEIEDRKHFGKVVGQKRKKQAIIDAFKKPGEEPKKVQPEEDKEKYVTKEDLVERDFQAEKNSLDCSDELKQQVETYARLNKCSPKEAFKSKYISYLKEQEDKKAEEEEAAAGGTRRTRPETIKGKKPEEMSGEGDLARGFDLSTKEGREAYAEYKKEHKLP